MKITVLTGVGETEFSSNICLARALRTIGHEVWIVGPNYHNTYGEQAEQAKEADVVLKDTDYPHFYSYQEILKVSPWTPDVIFAIDPRGALNGNKPKGITSCFYSTDQHRAGELHMRLIKEGNYDVVFIGQGAYYPFFYESAPTTQRVHTLWPAVEASRFPPNIRDEPVCDIVFVGHSGIGESSEPYSVRYPRVRYSGDPPSYDYAERAEFLLRLSEDFDVRIYSGVWKTPDFCRTLQQGRIGFNRSILHDCSIRNFEVMAAGRPLVADEIPFPAFKQLMGTGCAYLYPSLYRPFYSNFDVEYDYVKRIITELLENVTERENMGFKARNYVLERHTWGNRAIESTEILEHHMGGK